MSGVPIPRVLIDGVVFENLGQIGIWRAFYEIMRRLAGQVRFTVWLRAPSVQPLPLGVKIVHGRGRTHPARRNLPGRAWNRLTSYLPLPREVAESHVFHSTYFTPCPVPGPVVVTTIHDMIAELAFPYSGGLSVWLPHILAKRAAIDASQLFIAVSAATAADFVRLAPVAAERIRVVCPGHEHLILSSPVPSTTCQSRYALFVGHRDGYKNFYTVLEAMNTPRWPSGVSVRLVGNPLSEHEQRLIAYLGLTERIVDMGRLSVDQLAAQYAQATCFVFPSRLEGFGLPVLEAQINGCPVVCSDIPVFREVAGEAAVFFDPRIGEKLAEAVALACEPSVRRHMVEGGRANARRFSWDRTAEQMLGVYQEAAFACR